MSLPLGKFRSAGVTLLEMMVILAVLGILVAAGVPSLTDTLGRMSASSAARAVANTLSLARSEAIKRGVDMSICASTDGADCAAGGWSSGWIVFIDANGDADGDSGSVDAGDTVIQVYEPLADMVLSASTDLLRYNNRGYGLNGAVQTFKICPEDDNARNARAIEVAVSGRGRLIENGLTCP